jgi:hypothetical protein
VALVAGVGMVVKGEMVFTVAVMQEVELHMVVLIYLVNLAVEVVMSVRHLQRLVVV